MEEEESFSVFSDVSNDSADAVVNKALEDADETASVALAGASRWRAGIIAECNSYKMASCEYWENGCVRNRLDRLYHPYRLTLFHRNICVFLFVIVHRAAAKDPNSQDFDEDRK